MKRPTPRRAPALACVLGAACGGLLILAGVAWSLYGGGNMVYSPEQANEWDEASTAWHAATIGHPHERSPGAAAASDDRDAAVAAARDRFLRADAALRSARFMNNRLGPLLVWIGLAVAGGFGVGYLVVRGERS